MPSLAAKAFVLRRCIIQPVILHPAEYVWKVRSYCIVKQVRSLLDWKFVHLHIYGWGVLIISMYWLLLPKNWAIPPQPVEWLKVIWICAWRVCFCSGFKSADRRLALGVWPGGSVPWHRCVPANGEVQPSSVEGLWLLELVSSGTSGKAVCRELVK